MSEVYSSVGRVARGVINCTIGAWKRIGYTIANAAIGIGTGRYSSIASSSSSSFPTAIGSDVSATSASLIGRLQSTVARSGPAHNNLPGAAVGGGGGGGRGGGGGGGGGGGVTTASFVRRALPLHFPFSSWLPWAARSLTTAIASKKVGGAAASSAVGNAHQWEEAIFTRVTDPSFLSYADVNKYFVLSSPHVLSRSPLGRDLIWSNMRGERHMSSASVTGSGAAPDADEGQRGTEETSSMPVDADEVSIMIDRSGLHQPIEHNHGPSANEGAAWKHLQGPMSRHIESLIRFCGGPITLAEYMEEVLTNPTAGYYMHRDVFGTDGDFVTSPDISQMFGEMLGIWTVCLWQQMGCPKRMRLVELGPGRGTLMSDLLRGTAQFQPFAASLSVHLVECSPALRQLQWKAMRCSANSLTSDGSTSGSTDTSQESSTVQRDPVPVQQAGISAISQVPVSWHLQLEDIPRGDPAIVIAHEFFDALPVHQFQMTDRGWCEKLVDVAQQPRDQEFRCVLSPHPTPAVSLYLKRRLMLMSPEERRHHKQMEVCPAGMKLAVDLAKRVGEDGGAALIIDYGEDHAMADTLQAIRKHEFVDVLETPGLADLSAYVDFEALRQAVKSSGANAVAFGPITQAELLGKLGIASRLEALLQQATEKQALALQEGYRRLVGGSASDPSMASEAEGEGKDATTPDGAKQYEGMGIRYKAMAIVSKDLSGPPVCFEDDDESAPRD